MAVENFLSSFTGNAVDSLLSTVDDKIDSPRLEGEKGQALKLNSILLPQWEDTYSQHVFIKYSHNFPESDSDMKDEPDAWIGIYFSVNPVPPTIYTLYKWYLIEGTVGSVGPKGETGDRGPTGNEGARGETGRTFKVYGYFQSLSELKSSVSDPLDGDAYIIGSSSNYTIYIYSSELGDWENTGMIEGPQGFQGITGPTGAKGPTGDQGPAGLGKSVSVSELLNGVRVVSDGNQYDIFNGSHFEVKNNKTLAWVSSVSLYS